MRFATQPELGDRAGRWCFWQYRPTAEYLLAICAERRDGEMPTLRIGKTIPMLTDEELRLQLLKTSELRSG